MTKMLLPSKSGWLAPARPNRSQEITRFGRSRIGDARALVPEEYARLHAEIEQAAGVAGCFVVGITSAVYGEGKTTVAMNLAGTIAKNSSNRVALIDMNLRSRDLQTRINMGDCPGLVDVLEGAEDDLSCVIHRTQLPNFTIVPAGREAGNPARLNRSPRLAEALNMLRAVNDFIVIDMAPVLPVTDSRILARLLDGIVMVVRAGVTPREIVSRAIDAIGSDRVMGVVLNGTTSTMPHGLRQFFGGSFAGL